MIRNIQAWERTLWDRREVQGSGGKSREIPFDSLSKAQGFKGPHELRRARGEFVGLLGILYGRVTRW